MTETNKNDTNAQKAVEAEKPATETLSESRSYLVIADDSEEFQAALHYAAHMATAHNGHVSIAHIQDTQDFMHWGAVEDIVRDDMRTNSEKVLWHVSGACNKIAGQTPSLYIREGKAINVIRSIIEEDPRIVCLILGASTSNNNPGPLVSHFSGKALTQMNIPVIIVPGHLEKDKIKSLVYGNL